MPSTARGVARSTGWIVLDRATATVCGFLSLAITARTLGAEGLGRLAVAQTFVPLFLFLADWGVGTALSAELSRKQERPGHLLGTAMLVRVPMAATAWLACMLGAWTAGYRGERLEEILIFSLILWLPIADAPSTIFPVALRMRAPTLVSVGSSALQVGLLALCGALHAGARIFLAAVTAASLVRSVGTAFVALRRADFPLGFDPRLARRLIRSGALLSAAAVFAVAVSSLPTLILERLHGTAEVGFYSVGTRVLVLFYALPFALMTTVLPTMARELQTNLQNFEKIYRKTRDLLFWLAITTGVAAMVLARPAVELMFGSGFSRAVVPFTILLWQPLLVCPWIVASNALIAQRREMTNFLLVAMTCGFTVLACALMIPTWGAVGAAAASVLNFVPVAVISSRMLRRSRACRPVAGVEAQSVGMIP